MTPAMRMNRDNRADKADRSLAYRVGRPVVLLVGLSVFALRVGAVWADAVPSAIEAADYRGAGETVALRVQATVVDQVALAFHSPYQGQNSLDPTTRGRETADLTVYGGVRPWTGGEIWINAEVDQGFGLSNTLGLAGFPSGEAYKVGHSYPYAMIHRWFLRQTLDLGGQRQKVEQDQNQLAGVQGTNRLVFTVGKISVVDIFDTNSLAHDPRGDFFNWAIIDAGTFDYAANSWGYSYGGAVEAYWGAWTGRAGIYAMSRQPNGESLDASFRKFQSLLELERRFTVAGQPGSVKLTGFLTRAPMGAFAEALRQGQLRDTTPNFITALRYQSHSGVSLNLQQTLTQSLGLFARIGVDDGHQQSYEFADIDRTASVGLSLIGGGWGRPNDAFGVAGVVDDISKAYQTYLQAGGLGILIGDGRLPHPGAEAIYETYYSLGLPKGVKVSFDYQCVENPAYNRDRGPVSILGLRLHVGL